jgi:hypothetical protein
VPQPHFEIPVGNVDGHNRDFQVSLPYTPGSIAVWRNGQLQTKPLDDGWLELSPGTGVVRLKEAPLVGDVIQIFYNDTTVPHPCGASWSRARACRRACASTRPCGGASGRQSSWSDS